MKTLALVILAISSPAFAEGIEQYCAGARIARDGNSGVCARAPEAALVLKGKPGGATRVPTAVSSRFVDAIDAGYMPDADTNGIYHYVQKLVDARGALVGYLVVSGYENYEMGMRAQFNAKYNRRGHLVAFSFAYRH